MSTDSKRADISSPLPKDTPLDVDPIQGELNELIKDYKTYTTAMIDILQDCSQQFTTSSPPTMAVIKKIKDVFKKEEITLQNLKGSFFSALQSYRRLAEEKEEKKEFNGKEHKAAIRIQQTFRKSNARKKYHIKHLDHKNQMQYPAFFIGNDPINRDQDFAKYKQDPQDTTPFVLVASSVLRAAELAMQFSNGIVLPKVIIIDSSQQVGDLWTNLRKFTGNYLPKEEGRKLGEEHFFKELPKFLEENKKLYIDSKDEDLQHIHRPQHIPAYLRWLSGKYGFDHLIGTITATTVIRQTWQDTATFVKLKKALDSLDISKIYVYLSHLTDIPEEEKLIESNIDLLKPVLSITSNCHNMTLFDYTDSKTSYLPPMQVSSDIYGDLTNLVSQYQTSINQSAQASYELAYLHELGLGVPKDEKQAFTLYNLAAGQGNKEAQYKLARSYEDDRLGLHPDNSKLAAQFDKLAADQGHAESQYQLARAYELGIGVDQDDKQAVHFYKLAADQGHAESQGELARNYATGIGVDQNQQQAVHYLQLAAAQGHKNSLYWLGNHYQKGSGVEKNLIEAARYYCKYIDAEVDQSAGKNELYDIALCHEEGIGVEINMQEAVHLYRFLAEKGFSAAQHRLALCYENGLGGLERDDLKAAHWYKLSSDSAQVQEHEHEPEQESEQEQLSIFRQFSFPVEESQQITASSGLSDSKQSQVENPLELFSLDSKLSDKSPVENLFKSFFHDPKLNDKDRTENLCWPYQVEHPSWPFSHDSKSSDKSPVENPARLFSHGPRVPEDKKAITKRKEFDTTDDPHPQQTAKKERLILISKQQLHSLL